MPETDDIQLLREFAVRKSDAAFAALVTRYVNLVYSVGLRQTGNSHAAEEITQAVFIILARKAGSLGPKTVLSGWLYQTARLTAANYRRTEFRRARREQEAYMQSVLNQTEPDIWAQIAPLLEDAMGKLGEKDRHAILLSFFEDKSLAEVGTALGASEDAAKMRVNRALEKLRKIFAKRGVTLTTTVIAGAVSANSVQAAPVGLAATVVATTMKGSTLTASIGALVKGTMKMMTYAKLKLAAGIGAAALLAVGTLTVALSEQRVVPSPPEENNPGIGKPTIVVSTRFMTVPTDALERVGVDWHPSESGVLTALLSPVQSNTVLRVLEQTAEVEFLSAPTIISQSGSAGSLSVTKAVELNGTNAYTGIRLNVTPYGSTNAASIDLNLIAEVRSLVDVSPQHDGSQRDVRSTDISVSAKLIPGETIAIRRTISEGELYLTKIAEGQRTLLILATPSLGAEIITNGMRLHSIIQRKP